MAHRFSSAGCIRAPDLTLPAYVDDPGTPTGRRAPAGVLADCLRGLEAAQSVHTAARSRILAAFTAQSGYEADGCGSPVSWLAWQARTTRVAARAAAAWVRRVAAHPRAGAALAAGQISGSYARGVCEWSGGLPEDFREDADRILLAAQAGGADLADLAGLVAEMLAPVRPAGHRSG